MKTEMQLPHMVLNGKINFLKISSIKLFSKEFIIYKRFFIAREISKCLGNIFEHCDPT